MSATWRIRDRSTFAQLARDGRRTSSGPLRVTWLPSSDATSEPPRLAYVVGRRVGTAVDRNQVRRHLRAAAADLAPDLASGAYLVAFRGQPGAPYRDLRDHFVRAARSAGAIRSAA